MAVPKNTHRYDDIIHLPHPVSARHAPMSNGDRAAQFSPFAALTGYEEIISETARQTTPRIELEESELQMLNAQYQYLQMNIKEQPVVHITYFEEDRFKEGGSYQTIKACIKKIDAHNKQVVLTSGQSIPMGDIIHLFF